MENIRALKSYTFLRKDGVVLTLTKGRVVGHNGIECGDDAQRWMVRGHASPIPVRNGTWFSGFSLKTMRQYLEKEGYAYQGYADRSTGTMHISNDFFSKANEMSMPDTVSENHFREADRDAFEFAIKFISDNNSVIKAIRLYRFVYNASLHDAREAVSEILNRLNVEKEDM